MIHNGGDGSRVDISLCLERLDVVESSGVKELRGNRRHQMLSDRVGYQTEGDGDTLTTTNYEQAWQ